MPYTYDVHTEGGGLKNCQILRTNSTDRLREMRTRGREGVKNPENFANVLYKWSPSTNGHTAMIQNFYKSPQFYEVGGTCCWKAYSKTKYRGEGEILKSGSDRQKNRFPIKSVKLADCE